MNEYNKEDEFILLSIKISALVILFLLIKWEFIREINEAEKEFTRISLNSTDDICTCIQKGRPLIFLSNIYPNCDGFTTEINKMCMGALRGGKNRW